MAAQPPMPASRYQEFRRSHLDGCPEDMYDFGKLVDEDGFTLYETVYSGLFLKIIKLNDVATLDRYLATITRRLLGPYDSHLDDPFWIAAAYGSTDALCRLLMHRDATDFSTLPNIPALDKQGYGLLQTACKSAHIGTVRFLLDGPWKAVYGDVNARDNEGCTALLMAAASFVNPGYPEDRANSHDSIQSYLTCAEEVMQLLLNRGACVQDAIISQGELEDTVLSMAICGASPALVKRLIDQGADVYVKKTHDPRDGGVNWGSESGDIKNVTVLHIGSKYSNIGGIQVLLDHVRTTGGIDMVQQTDSLGRLPLHWAAWGPDLELYKFEAEEIVPHVTATVELLLAANPSTINAQDKEGDTTLHYAVRRHGCCGDRHVAIPRVLCKYGADASLRGRNGETPLHALGFRVMNSEPVDTSLIDLLLEHGASVGDKDQDGNTPLHYAARNLLHIEAARHLVSKGADVSATNRQGNTPLHQAANGVLFSLGVPGSKPFTVDDRVKAQDEMIRVLLHHVSGDTADALMDQPNADDRTPRQISEEKRKKWRDDEEAERNRAAGRGRGRGSGRGGGRGSDIGVGRGRGRGNGVHVG